MKKKGFTLIELLAVVVVLAIIALIAIPQLTKLVENAKIGAVKNSVYGMMEAGELSYIYNEEDVEDGQLTYTCDGKSCKTESGSVLKFKGRVPDEGEISISKDKSSDASFIKFGEYCAYGTRENLDVWKGKCEFEAGLYNSKNELVVPWDEIETKYGVVLDNYFTYSAYGSYDHSYAQSPNFKNENSIPLNEILNNHDAYPELADIKKVVIKKGIKGINKYTFKDTKELDEVILPNTLVFISYSAFENSGIKNIIFPNSIDYLGSAAFRNCDNLEKIVLSKNIRYSGASIFESCNKLKELKISDNLEIIDKNFCYGCNRLETIKFGKNVKEIDDNAFYNIDIKELVIPDSVEKIGFRSFHSKNLRNIYIGSGAKDLSRDSFSYINSGSPNVFEKIVISKNNKYYEDGNVNAIIDKRNKKLILGTHNTNTIPNDVVSIGPAAFIHIDKPFSLKLSNSLKTIESQAFHATNITHIDFGHGIERIESNAFYFAKLVEVILPESVTYIGDWAFANLNDLKKVVIPNSLKVISEFAFQGGGLGKPVDIIIPSGVEEIQNDAFYNTKFKNSNIFNEENEFKNLRQVGQSAFQGSNLDSVFIPRNLENLYYFSFGEFNHLKVSKYNKKYIDMNSDVVVEKDTMKLVHGSNYSIVPDGVKEIATGAFYRRNFKNANVVLPDSVEKIDDMAFAQSQISSITLNKNLKNIGKDAFGRYQCSGDFLKPTNSIIFNDPNGWSAIKYENETRTIVKENIDLSNKKANSNMFDKCNCPGCVWEKN